MSMRPPSLSGKRALVTGAAQGIGQAYAVRLAQDGADLILVDVQDCSETLASVHALGRQATAFPCDLTDAAAIEQTADVIKARFGGCDILVNNAGAGSALPFETITHQRLRSLLALNLEAPFLLCKAFVPGMKEKGWGRIVNMTTSTLDGPVPHFVDYVMTKGGVLGLTRSLASELGAAGITVNAISPGLVRTPLTERGREGHAAMPEQGFEMARRVQSIPTTMVPGDLVGTLSFLVSVDAALITGQNLHVDGGSTRI